ncbi:tRNA (N6-threonylcarbamoyladenosine(37)-N6)-methyltransferase TrmO [Pseudidiomarina sp.]|uniref:tRNA (N6-threonylcarbamoyladenosine(37)-N6)-methyltransferase TrmO n=1 Tax=Pseudidiomarina sp. TaxID=2081707 RepID=UPI00299E4400|nr:tRNA (N6-threonylcarbamoyladenosine(37)-N6)-methyltransferase TrmO [Pseudidiomarina sp.]MDX1706915.1 tRNA (N6-threonylcarbamoyladenosine(37)-N6)-methyltransferase TrmO [Pseudidiomarina sp.]
MQHQLDIIGYVKSPYSQKFAAPRQPGLVTAATSQIILNEAYSHPDCVRGLKEFSHIWVLFLFHETLAGGWKPLVRPPRLGGNERKGVFATRSTFRPNAIGMSAVQLTDVTHQDGRNRIEVVGADWVDGTPIIDIKPYLAYADSYPDAISSFAQDKPEAGLTTHFSPGAQQQLARLQQEYPNLATLIAQVLQQDPRPAYKQNNEQDKIYGMSLYDLNIRWQVINSENHVISISKDF